MGDCKGANQGFNKYTMMAVKAHASIVQETACCNLVCTQQCHRNTDHFSPTGMFAYEITILRDNYCS